MLCSYPTPVEHGPKLKSKSESFFSQLCVLWLFAFLVRNPELNNECLVEISRPKWSAKLFLRQIVTFIKLLQFW